MGAPPKDLILLRLAMVTLTPKPNGWRKWTLQLDDIEVAPVSAYESENNLKLLLRAATVLDFRPKVTADGWVVVPARQRAAAERAVALAANLLAVAQGCRRHIGSPWPSVALIARNDKGRSWLKARAGIQRGRLKSTPARTSEQIDLDSSVLNQLGDRDDGVALLVEALAHDHAMGRFHEFARLFERAFARPAKTLVEPLSRFLEPSFGYDDDELRNWFEELRDAATHADARNEFLLEADVRPVIDRMEQAAFDVLLNKATWRDPSRDRRQLWKPRAGTTSRAGDAFIVQGATPVTSATILDEYGAFPMDFDAIISPRPANWWPQKDELSSATEQFGIRILPKNPERMTSTSGTRRVSRKLPATAIPPSSVTQ